MSDADIIRPLLTRWRRCTWLLMRLKSPQDPRRMFSMNACECVDYVSSTGFRGSFSFSCLLSWI